MGNVGFFDAEAVEPLGGDFEVMPEGLYTLMVTESEVKVPRSGNGKMLSLTMEVVDGEYKGRKVWENITLEHNNPKAVNVGKGKLSGLCRAAGVLKLTDSSQLHNRPFQAKLKVRPADGDYRARNEVAGYLANGGLSTTAPAQTDDSDIPEWLKAAGAW